MAQGGLEPGAVGEPEHTRNRPLGAGGSCDSPRQGVPVQRHYTARDGPQESKDSRGLWPTPRCQ